MIWEDQDILYLVGWDQCSSTTNRSRDGFFCNYIMLETKSVSAFCQLQVYSFEQECMFAFSIQFSWSNAMKAHKRIADSKWEHLTLTSACELLFLVILWVERSYEVRIMFISENDCKKYFSKKVKELFGGLFYEKSSFPGFFSFPKSCLS